MRAAGNGSVDDFDYKSDDRVIWRSTRLPPSIGPFEEGCGYVIAACVSREASGHAEFVHAARIGAPI
jgi:hypothetical protein